MKASGFNSSALRQRSTSRNFNNFDFPNRCAYLTVVGGRRSSGFGERVSPTATLERSSVQARSDPPKASLPACCGGVVDGTDTH